jgi:hypothetical protein
MTRRLICFALVMFALAANCFGTVISNVAITGLFRNPTDDTPGVQAFDPAITPAGASTITTVVWGEPPVLNGPQSGYAFAANLAPGSINVNPPPVSSFFNLGTFTHNNFVVDNPYLTSVLLDVIMTFDVDGVSSGPHTFTYLFNHTETPNQIETAPPGIPVCPFLTPKGGECTDRVVLSNSGGPQSFTVGGVTFTLELFLQKGGINLSEFITNEGQSNEAQLVGRFSAADSTVPEPGTAGAVGVALAAFGVSRYRKLRSIRFEARK